MGPPHEARALRLLQYSEPVQTGQLSPSFLVQVFPEAGTLLFSLTSPWDKLGVDKGLNKQALNAPMRKQGHSSLFLCNLTSTSY